IQPPPRHTLFPYTTLFRSTGGLTAVTIRAQGNAFFIVADFRSGGQVVLVRYSDRKPRQFVDPGTALKLVRSIGFGSATVDMIDRSEEHTSELQSRENLVCR